MRRRDSNWVRTGIRIIEYQRYAGVVGGDTGPVNYLLDVSHFQTDGYRRHSEAQRNLLNGKVRVKLDDVSQLTFIANAVEMPFVQDPWG